jgi:hypothetical protein
MLDPARGEGKGSLPPDKHIDPVFCAQIIDQGMASTADGDLQLVLTVRIHCELNDPQDVSAGVKECAPLEREVKLTFIADNDNRLRMAVRDLDRLGFSGDDICQLHPDHPQTHSLSGRNIHVRRKIVNGVEYFNLAWPGEKPGPVAVDELQDKAKELASRIAAVRRPRKDKAKKNDPPQGSSSGKPGE